MIGADFILIGGGLVGSEVAYGRACKCAEVQILDAGDLARRDSRGEPHHGDQPLNPNRRITHVH